MATQNLSTLFPVPLKASANLSDLQSVTAALTALGLGTTAAAELARIGAAPAGNYAQIDDVRQLMIQIAKLQGKVAGYASGFADDYQDQSGVDTANSSGFTYDATNKLFTNVTVETSQSLPAMTSNSAPSGSTASGSSSLGSSYDYFDAFDQSTSTNWVANGSSLPQYVQRQLSTAYVMAGYTVGAKSDTNPTSWATAWTLLGSNDGQAWTTLDTQSNAAFSNPSQILTFSIPAANRASYTYYRLNITAMSSGYAGVSEFGLLKQITPALDLRSVAVPASIVPGKAGLFVLVKPLAGGVITPNTNLVASVSRTGSASPPTWTQVPLVAAGSVGGFSIYEANGVDISGQASGSSMRTRLQTSGGLAIQAQANVMQWAQ